MIIFTTSKIPTLFIYVNLVTSALLRLRGPSCPLARAANLARLLVVPHFSSGMVERAKRERT